MKISLKELSAWVSILLLLLVREETNCYIIDHTADPATEDASNNNPVDSSANRGHFLAITTKTVNTVKQSSAKYTGNSASLDRSPAAVESRRTYESLKHLLFPNLNFSKHNISRWPCIKKNCSTFAYKRISENDISNGGKETSTVVRGTASFAKDLTESSFNRDYSLERIRRDAKNISSGTARSITDSHAQHKRAADTKHTSPEVHPNLTSMGNTSSRVDANITEYAVNITEDTVNISVNTAEALNASILAVPEDGAEDTATGTNCPTLDSCSTGCPDISSYRGCRMINIMSVCPWKYHWESDPSPGQPEKQRYKAKCLSPTPCYIRPGLLICQEFMVDGVPVACVATFRPMEFAKSAPTVVG